MIEKIQEVREKRQGRKKVLILTQTPRSAIFAYKILSFIGLNVECLTSSMTPYARGARFEDFNGPNGPVIMIATYDLKLAGINAHYQCCVVIHLEPGLSIAVEEQAGLRIRRRGADEMQHRYRLHLTETYMDEHQAGMEAKYWGIAVGMGHISAAVSREYSAAEYMSATLGGGTVGRRAGLSYDQGVDEATAHEVLILGCSQAHLAIAARRHHALAAASASAIIIFLGEAVPQFKHHL